MSSSIWTIAPTFSDLLKSYATQLLKFFTVRNMVTKSKVKRPMQSGELDLFWQLITTEILPLFSSTTRKFGTNFARVDPLVAKKKI